MWGVGIMLAFTTLLSLLLTKIIVPSHPHSDLIVLGLDVGQAYLGLLWCLATHRLGNDPLLVKLFWVGTAIGATWEVGWSEKHKSWKRQNERADYEPRHSTDFRTILEIMF